MPVVVGIDAFYGDDVVRGAVPVRPADTKAMEALFATLDRAAAEGNGPIAVGFDVDLSPGSGPIEPEEHTKLITMATEFSEKRNIPVFLGVGRTFNRSSELWLERRSSGETPIRYAAMIAQLSRDLERQPAYFIKNSSERSLADLSKMNAPEKLYSMAAKLSTAYANHLKSIRRTERNYEAPQLTKRSLDDGDVYEYAVDYAPLDLLVANTIHCVTPKPTEDVEEAAEVMTDQQVRSLRGRVVLIGRAKGGGGDLVAFDTARIHAGTSIYRGVYVHACAFYSYGVSPIVIAHGPLFNLAEFVLIALAFLCSVAKLSNFQFDEAVVRSRFGRVSDGQLRFFKKICGLGAFFCFASLIVTMVWVAYLLFAQLDLVTPARVLLVIFGFSVFLLFFRCIGQFRGKTLSDDESLGEALLAVTRWGLVGMGVALTVLLLALPTRYLWLGFVPSLIFVLTEPHIAPALEAAFDAVAVLTNTSEA